MRKGIAPKIDALVFLYDKKKQVMDEWERRRQFYSLRFFDDGTVICVDNHEGPDGWNRYFPRYGPNERHMLNSIGVFEVCD